MTGLFLFLFSLMSCGPKAPWEKWDECGYTAEEYACGFTLTDQDGAEVELYDHYEKVIILDFSTMWCGVCQYIGNAGDAIVEEYGEENVVWITVLIDDFTGDDPDVEDLQQWADYFEIKGPVLAGSGGMLDATGADGWQVDSFPTIVVIDTELRIYSQFEGWTLGPEAGQLISAWTKELLR